MFFGRKALNLSRAVWHRDAGKPLFPWNSVPRNILDGFCPVGTRQNIFIVHEESHVGKDLFCINRGIFPLAFVSVAWTTRQHKQIPQSNISLDLSSYSHWWVVSYFYHCFFPKELCSFNSSIKFAALSFPWQYNFF